MTGRHFLSGPPGDLAATIAATTPRTDLDGPMMPPRTDYTAPPEAGAAARAFDDLPIGTVAVDSDGVAYQREDDGRWAEAGFTSRWTSRWLVNVGARVVWRPEATT